jgi:hypothetical protein
MSPGSELEHAGFPALAHFIEGHGSSSRGGRKKRKGPRSAKQRAATKRMLAANKRGKKKSHPKKKRKGPRSAKQKAATKKMLAANKRKRKGHPKKKRKGSKKKRAKGTRKKKSAARGKFVARGATMRKADQGLPLTGPERRALELAFRPPYTTNAARGRGPTWPKVRA